MNKLETCPFCGGQPKSGKNYNMWVVCCDNDECKIQPVICENGFFIEHKNSGGRGYYNLDEAKNKAITTWNMRA